MGIGPGPGTSPAGPGRPPVTAPPGSTSATGVNPLWWLLPILFGLLGGLVAFLVNRDRDPRTARAMLIVGAGLTILLTLLYATGGAPATHP